jgi:hypothetical protein
MSKLKRRAVFVTSARGRRPKVPILTKPGEKSRWERDSQIQCTQESGISTHAVWLLGAVVPPDVSVPLWVVVSDEVASDEVVSVPSVVLPELPLLLVADVVLLVAARSQ